LTHRAYFIQTKKIKPNYNTKLEKLLSIFEQANFIDRNTTTKGYSISDLEPGMKEIIDILQYIAGDKDTRKALDKEAYYQEALVDMFGERDQKIADRDHRLAEKDIIIAENEQKLKENEQKLLENEQKFKENEQKLLEKDKKLSENEQKLSEKDKLFSDKQKQTARDLKDLGIDIETITKITGITKEEILSL
jgi:hypothetical protein